MTLHYLFEMLQRRNHGRREERQCIPENAARQTEELRWRQRPRKRDGDVMQSKPWSLLLYSLSNIYFTYLKDTVLSLDFVVVVLANVDPDQVTDNYHHLVQRYLLPFFFKKKPDSGRRQRIVSHADGPFVWLP